MSDVPDVIVNEQIGNDMQLVNLVQRLVMPEPGINSEYPLFFHHHGGVAGFDTLKKAYFAQRGATISFNSYFNSFPVHLYDLDEHAVDVEIKASGTFIVQIVMARHGRSWEQLYQSRVELTDGEVEKIRLPTMLLDGLIYVEIISLRDTLIYDVDYSIVGEIHQSVSLTAVITTFKRDEAVQETGRRMQSYFENNVDLLDKFKLLVIDNGGDTDSIPFEKSTVIKNRNLGGAGGFTRGLMEVVENQLSSHVLFMDDDASFFPESLRRTMSVLQYSKTDNRAVCGAMITESHKWRMWENGATFDQRCKPIDNGRDLGDFGEVVAMSIGQPRNIDNKYAGWWYFCFPIASVNVWPFPFFVRGDDSYFSLANDFDIITMPGVVAIQEDFFTKQTPLTLYLDMRYHLVHHLTFENIEIGQKSLSRLMSKFFNRFNNSYHYESADAICQAIEDVLAGDSFWEQNVDMAERRKLINSNTQNEKIQNAISMNLGNVTHHAPQRNKGRWKSLLRRFSYNGHLLPDSLQYQKGVVFPLDVRAIEHDTFLRPYTITVDPASGKGYICKIDKQAYFDNRKRFKDLVRKLEANYEQLSNQYKELSKTLAAKAAWEERFKSE
ncbi:Putative uncharacterized protein [Halomonas sp. R57-5]|uniref:glycosyltransferase family 2 protein n=1 Tax=Halomonas sp. R57-5 TaxID=1610576 RepID=UPI0005FC907D|nr:glycosyltransferase [Halomonas sp. R57-5]CEP36876.1 Putative uncharacterized protein [Halomonas sp. R57-5]